MGEAKRRLNYEYSNRTMGTFGYDSGLLDVIDIAQMAEFVTIGQQNILIHHQRTEAGESADDLYKIAFRENELVFVLHLDLDKPFNFACRIAKGGALNRQGMAGALKGERPYTVFIAEDGMAGYRLALRYGDEAMVDAYRDIQRFVGLMMGGGSKRPWDAAARA